MQSRTLGLPGLKSAVSALFYFWRLLLIVVATCGSLSAYHNFFSLKDLYESKATIQPKNSRSASSFDALLGQIGARGGAAIAGAALAGLNTESQHFRLILNSKNIAEQVGRQGDIAEKLLGRPFKESAKDVNKIVRRLQKALVVSLEGQAVHISYTSEDPELSQKVTQGYLDGLQNFLNRNITSQSLSTENFIRERLKELNSSLDESEKKLARLKIGATRPLSERSLQTEILRAEREFRRVIGLIDLLSQQYEVSQIESKRNDPMFMVIEPPIRPLYPSGPNRIFNIIVATIFSFVCASTLLLIFIRLKSFFGSSSWKTAGTKYEAKRAG